MHPSPTACSQRRHHSTQQCHSTWWHRSPSLSGLQKALRKLWYEESPGRITVREAKPPNPTNSPHQVAKDHKTCAAAKKSQRDLPPPPNGLRSQKARLCLGPLLSHRPGWDGDTSRASPATTSGLALPAAPGHSQPQLRHRFHVSPRASPWPTQQYCTAGRKRCPDTVNLFFGGMEGYAFNFFPLKLCFFKHQGMGKESFGSWTPSRLEQHLWLVVSHSRGSGAPALRLCKCSLSTFFFQWNVLSKRKILKGCNSNFGGECSVTTLPVCKGQNSEGPTNLF